MSDYPTAHTVIYPAYCYPNFNKAIFSIGCTTQLLLSLLALLTTITLSCFLFRLRKTNQQQMLLVAFSLAIVSNLLTFIYYFFIVAS